MNAFGQSTLWDDALGIPAAIERTLDDQRAIDAAARTLAAPGTRRIVVSGNGASWYAGLSVWFASLMDDRVEVAAVPAGLLGSGTWRWRKGDALLAISSSGELSDLIAAQAAFAGTSSVAITSEPGSPIGRAAAVALLLASDGQRAHTHTRSYCASIAAALAVWATIADDQSLRSALAKVAAEVAAALEDALPWAGSLVITEPPTDAITFGAGSAWAAALEAALLLKEVAAVPAEGCELREGATSATFALSPASLVVSIPAGCTEQDEGAEAACRSTGATVIRLPVEPIDTRLSAIVSFPHALALSGRLAELRGIAVDQPAWVQRYYATVRMGTSGAGP